MKYEVNVKNKEAVSTRFSRVLRRGKLLGGQGGPGNQAWLGSSYIKPLN